MLDTVLLFWFRDDAVAQAIGVWNSADTTYMRMLFAFCCAALLCSALWHQWPKGRARRNPATSALFFAILCSRAIWMMPQEAVAQAKALREVARAPDRRVSFSGSSIFIDAQFQRESFLGSESPFPRPLLSVEVERKRASAIEEALAAEGFETALIFKASDSEH